MEAVVVDHECCGGVPPGFRFHPTEEELVGYYLARKVASQKIDLDIIQEVDLYRIEPWDLQRRLQLGGGGSGSGDQCFFFSYKDRKYPSGTRTNRATAAGFWKATGRDKPVMSSSSSSSSRSGSIGAGGIVIGMRKTLVFYKGRAPNGRKTDWIIHEYRLLLPSTDNHHQQQGEQEGWVVCRAFRKPTTIPNNIPPPLAGAAGAYAFFGSSTRSSSSWLSHQPQLPLDLSYYPPYADEPPHKASNNNLLLMRIPQLIDDDSPTAAVHIQGSGGGGQYDDDAAGSIIDMNFLDTLLSSSTAAASSFAAPP